MNEAWKELKQACAQCHRCGLGETRHSLVFGDGAENARIMLIGEGPGEQEDRQGVPFVGPAGKLLDDMLEMIYLDRTKVYIANIVKCRPPHNRDVNGRRYMAIYHPSALLRDPSKRPETFVDLKTLQREIYARCPEVYPDA